MKISAFYGTAVLLVILFCARLPAQYGFLNTPRVFRIGLESLGCPGKWHVTPSTGYIEIFSVKLKQAIYTGAASRVAIYLNKGKMCVAIDDKKASALFDGEIRLSPVGKIQFFLKLTNAASGKSGSYRGSIAIYKEGSALRAVNIIDIEDYLKSVVPSEIYNRSPKAAQEAQAIAARTYAIRNRHRHHPKKRYQLCDMVHCQAYKGVVQEIKAASEAVKKTCGQILIYKTEPANTVYHSNCGGYILSSSAVWNGAPIPYLTGHYDGFQGEKPFCSYGYKIKNNKTVTNLPKPHSSIKHSQSFSGRHATVHKHFGHRVGMCQDGAIGMAAIGYSARKIIYFYYPQTKLVYMNYALPKKKGKPKKGVGKDLKLLVAKKPPNAQNKPLAGPSIAKLIQPEAKTASKQIATGSGSVKATLRALKSSKRRAGLVKLKKMFWVAKEPKLSHNIN